MPFSPQDYRSSRVRARSMRTADPVLRLVYIELLFALWESDGSLPADPATLADQIGVEASEIERCLPILESIGRRGRGGLKIESGMVSNARILEEIAKAKPAKPIKPSIEFPPELDTAEFRAAWAAWAKHRRERRSPLTASTVERQLSILSKCGARAAVLAIERSIEKGWLGLFPRSETRNGVTPEVDASQYRLVGQTVSIPDAA